MLRNVKFRRRLHLPEFDLYHLEIAAQLFTGKYAYYYRLILRFHLNLLSWSGDRGGGNLSVQANALL